MTLQALTTLIDATWPAKSIVDLDGWKIRNGAGGGNRVSAASQLTSNAQIEKAESAMCAFGQTPLFMVPVTFYTAPTAQITTQRPPAVTCFQVWPPLATQAEIWNAGGIDDARLAIMNRAAGPKTTVLGRVQDKPAGTAFCAIHDGIAMLHAIETRHAFRRQGLGRHMIRALAFWAQDHNAHTIALLVTKANIAANALYTSLGMIPVGGYHYRIYPET
jgi:GNAT superfamily N-acetyltransferase